MIYFDTLQYVKTLEISGFSQQQAEALAKAQQSALSESLETTLATKQDITEVKKEIADLRTGLKEEISNLRHETKVDFCKLESRINVHSWMLSALMAGMGALLLKAFF